MIYWLPPMKQKGTATEASYDLSFGSRMGQSERFTWDKPGFTGKRNCDSDNPLAMKPINSVTDSYITKGELVLEMFNCDTTCNSITVSNIEWMNNDLMDEYCDH